MSGIKNGAAALAVLMTAQPAFATVDADIGAPPVPAINVPAMTSPPPAPPAPPRPIIAQHAAAMAAPPVYVRPAYGYQLPKYWMSPEFYIADPRAMGLGRPARGFGWSRYHDDMVLTDQWGRVYDVRDGRDWGRNDSGRSSHDDDAAVAGIGGAAVGAVAGNLIAGAGSRFAGSLIGGGVGALAGLAIESATSKHRRRHRGYQDGWYREDYRGAHWGGGYYGYAACGCGEDVVTTTVTRTSWGGGTMVPRQVVTYENVYAPVARAAPGKMRAVEGKERRTTKSRPRVRGDY